jgi:hypothetical protein
VFRQNTHALFIFLKSYTHALLAGDFRGWKICGDGSGGIFEKISGCLDID